MSKVNNNQATLPEASLYSIVNAVSYGLILIDKKGSILFANTAIEGLFGYKIKTLLTKHINVLWLPSTTNERQLALTSFFLKPCVRKSNNHTSFSASHKDGSIMHVGVTLNTTIHENEECLLATFTPEKQVNNTDQLLNSSRDILARNIDDNKRVLNVSKNSVDAVFLIDQKHHITWVNIAGGILLDARIKELTNVYVLDVVNDKSLRSEKTKFALALEQGLSFTGELHLAFSSKSVAQVDCSLQPVFENERLQGFTLTARDITNRRLLEAKMRDNNELLETVARIASLGFYSLDIEKNELTWSEQVYKIHDLPVHSKIDVSQALDYYAPQAKDKISAAVERCMETGKPFDMELPFITAKSRNIWVRSVGYAEFVNGQPVKLKGAFQDITYMRQAALDAEQAANAKSSFLTNMSHELRTPINGILGISEVLLDTSLSVQQNEYLSMVQSSGRSLLFLVNQVLDYAKLNSGSQKLHESIINLSTFIQHKTYIHVLAANEKGCKFNVDISPLVPSRYLGDADRIGQIINNLCSNAVKFTDAGEIRVKADITQDNMLKFEIKDSGVGIHAKDIDSLFEEFQQLDSTLSRHHQGTGLGLTITKQLVELMSGEIGVTSTIGKGATFWFTLPVNDIFVNALPEAPDVLIPNTLVLAASAQECEQWRSLAIQQKMKIKAVETMPDLVAALKLDVHWALSIITAVPEGFPIHTCIASIFRVANSNHRVLVNEKYLDNQDLLQPNTYTMNMVNYAPNNLQEPLLYLFVALQKWYAQFTEVIDGNWHNKHILIVEDNEINQTLFIGLLSSTELKITIANNGKEALDILDKDDSINLVVMDCQMPVMDGFEATRQIRSHANSRISALRIAAATAHGFEEDIQACFDVGMNDVLVKPFNKKQLIEIISRNL